MRNERGDDRTNYRREESGSQPVVAPQAQGSAAARKSSCEHKGHPVTPNGVHGFGRLLLVSVCGLSLDETHKPVGAICPGGHPNSPTRVHLKLLHP
ncbi:MAG: hypothetical protein WDO68_00820 [Gammaproteobacteria bacterium]